MEKAKKKADEKALKDAERANAAPEPTKAPKKVESTDPSDPKEYFNSRVKMIQDLRDKEINPFPHKYHVSISIPDYLKKYDHVEVGNVLEDVTESIAGLNL